MALDISLVADYCMFFQELNSMKHKNMLMESDKTCRNSLLEYLRFLDPDMVTCSDSFSKCIRFTSN